MKLFVLAFSCGLFLTSCSFSSSDETLYYDEFPKSYNVVFETIETPEILHFIVDMVLLEDALITLDLLSNPFFQIFDTYDFTHIGGTIFRGNAPDEEVEIIPFINKVDHNTFMYRSLDKIKLLKYDKTFNTTHIITEIDLPDDFFEIYHICYLEDNIIGYETYDIPEREFKKYKIISKEVVDFGPENNKNNSNTNPGDMLFTRSLISHPDGTRFAALYDKYPLLRVYDNNGNLIKESWYNNQQLDPIKYAGLEKDFSEKFTMNYLKVKSTENYIYGLYAGKTHETLNSQNLRFSDFGFEIHIWNWDGLPVASIIPDRPISSFAVSPDDTYIIGSTIDENDKLYKIGLDVTF